SGDGDDDDNGGPDDDASPGFQTGPFTQVSRLGMPLINEVIIPLGKKDLWNTVHPRFDSQFLAYYQTPELQKLLPVLYPGVFPNGRRVLDDVIDIELRAIAGATLPLVDNAFTPDGAAGLVADGADSNPVQPPNTTPFLSTFPYLPHPVPGYEHSHDP